MLGERRQLAERRMRDPVRLSDVEVLVQEHRDDVHAALVVQLLVESRVLHGRARYMCRQPTRWLWTSVS